MATPKNTSMTLLLLTTVLSGCLGAGDDSMPPDASQRDPLAPQERHEVLGMRSFEVVADDGTALRGHVYLPDGEGPFATVLELSPYWNTAYRRSDDMVVDEDGRRTLWNWLGPFLEAGFAVALVNSRGTGVSEGCLQWGSPVDQSDAALVIEELADQEWSNGNVGMFGISYSAWTQYLAIASGAPSLKAVVPVSGIIDAYSWSIFAGAPLYSHALPAPFWWAGTGTGTFQAYGLAVGGTEAPFVPETRPSHAACPRVVEDVEAGVDPSSNGDRLPYHDARDLRPALAKTDVAVLVASGLQFAGEMGHVYQFHDVWDLVPHDDKRLLVGQWGHGDPLGDRDRFLYGYAVPWLDHYLRGGPVVATAGVVQYEDDDGTWHQTDAWPPKGEHVRLHLGSGTLHADEEGHESSSQPFASTDWRPLPDGCVEDKAVFVSPPLAEDVVLVGVFHANLTVSSDLPDGNFATHLWHTDELLPCERRVEEQATDDASDLLVGLSFSDLRHRGHLGQGTPFPTDAPDRMHMTSQPIASAVDAGQRLVLTIGGGDWALQPEARKPVLTVHTGPGSVGTLDLNVVEGRLRFVGEADGHAKSRSTNHLKQ